MRPEKTTERWMSALVCFVRSVAYDFETRTGRLDMPPVTCCDMDGCVQLFQRIDPDVRRIETYAGGLRDTCYERDDQLRWRSISHLGEHGQRHSSNAPVKSVTSSADTRQRV